MRQLTWKEKLLYLSAFWVCIAGVLHGMAWVVISMTTPGLSLWYAAACFGQIMCFLGAWTLLLDWKGKRGRAAYLELLDRQENQDRAEVAYFYEKNPRVHIIKPTENGILIYINPKFWIHIAKSKEEKDKYIMTTPPYKGVSHNQMNLVWQRTIKLEDLPGRIN